MKPITNHLWAARLGVCALTLVLGGLLAGCMAPMGAEPASTRRTYKQVHENALSGGKLTSETRALLHRYDQETQYEKSPQAALRHLHETAVKTRGRDLLFALAELNYHEGDRVRHSVKSWDRKDPREYYLASCIYAFYFLLGDAAEPPPSPYDPRFRTACEIYNYGLGWALTERKGTEAIALMQGGARRLPAGEVTLEYEPPGPPSPLAEMNHFLVADQFLVRGFSVRNRRHGLGAPLVGTTEASRETGFTRSIPATVFLRPQGRLAEMSNGQMRASLKLYSAFEEVDVQVGDQTIPLEQDTTIHTAYGLNQQLLWKLGMMQFLSAEETIPTGVYLSQPYQPGLIPVVFVHGTFSSPVWWSEMANTLRADPTIRQRYQFWFFIYNSGNPIHYSATRLRDSLIEEMKKIDPEGQDPALQQTVVVGHSQGGLLAKLTATDTGDKLWRSVSTNRIEDLDVTEKQRAMIRHYAIYEPLPFVKRVVFISTPHRGSYLAGNFLRRLAYKLISLPQRIVEQSKELLHLTEKMDVPLEMRGRLPTSLDGMWPKNKPLLALAEIPPGPGIKAHSIIAVEGDGDYKTGRDGLVDYSSAHVPYVESELIVRSFHSCQDRPATIEEVRRILLEHLQSRPAGVTNFSR